MKKPRIRYDIIVEVDGREVLDGLTSQLLLEVKNKGSLLKASQSLGIPYSKAWDMLNRAERILGERLIETWRGGGSRGGARLTRAAEELLNAYLAGEKKIVECIGPLFPRTSLQVAPSLIVAYSHDHIIEVIVERIKAKLPVEGVCSGSLRALAMLSLGESDVSCTHLYDPSENSYNESYLRKYYIENPVRLGGFEREVVFTVNPSLDVSNIEEVLELLRKGEIRIVNRNPGSGTRLYLDLFLEKASIDKSIIKGYDNVKFTHEEVAREIASGRSEAGITIRYYSELYGLNGFTVGWEKYECFTTFNRLGSEGVKLFREALNSRLTREMIDKLPGYRWIEVE
ncbi:MAG: LysR family transcriptional regulator [Desulfurococcales archaeon]|nr:LysR family transcriptional regulator [Desulfurococcales archaeon]